MVLDCNSKCNDSLGYTNISDWINNSLGERLTNSLAEFPIPSEILCLRAGVLLRTPPYQNTAWKGKNKVTPQQRHLTNATPARGPLRQHEEMGCCPNPDVQAKDEAYSIQRSKLVHH